MGHAGQGTRTVDSYLDFYHSTVIFEGNEKLSTQFDTIADCQPPARLAGYSLVNDDEA